MKVNVNFWDREDNSGGGFRIRSDVQGAAYSLCWYEDSPEDARYGRNLEDHSGIVDLIKAAYDAGLRNELLTIEEKDESEKD